MELWLEFRRVLCRSALVGQVELAADIVNGTIIIRRTAGVRFGLDILRSHHAIAEIVAASDGQRLHGSVGSSIDISCELMSTDTVRAIVQLQGVAIAVRSQAIAGAGNDCHERVEA